MNINAINCRPTDDNGNNRAPDNKEMQCCYKRVFKVIKEHKPKVIILIGGSALQSIIGTRVTKNLGALSKWRGFAIPDKHYKAWLCPVFHPSYVERADLPEIYNIWERDIENAFRCTLEGRPTNPAYKEYLDKVELLNEKEAGQVLKDISWREAAFDYEATGLKPHRKGHDIISVSISNGDRVFAFLLYDEIRDLFRKFLTNPKIGKIAHNMQFEHTWSEVILGVDVYPWVKDTMINAHVIDNRPGIKGLKHQVYLNFGIPDYSSEVDKYLKAKDSNSFNRIRELIQTDLGVKQLLQYNGLDSFFGFEYYNIQKSLI
jgi:desulfoferrodoxin (superoxide reductase-like protein)